MENDIVTKKLIILFLMEKMEIPLTENNIIDICYVKNNWINYMDCIDLLYHLADARLVYKNNCKENELRYTLTFEGRDCLSLFYKKIPKELRDEITEYSKNNKLDIKISQEYVSRYDKNEDGSYTLTFKIYEPLVNQPLFHLSVKAPTRQSAEEACAKWRNKAPAVYEYIYENLINTD